MKFTRFNSLMLLLIVALISCGKDDDNSVPTPKPVDFVQLDQSGKTYRFEIKNTPDINGDNAYYANSKKLNIGFIGDGLQTQVAIMINDIDLDNPSFPATFDTHSGNVTFPRLGWVDDNDEVFVSDEGPVGFVEDLTIVVSSFSNNRIIGTFEGTVYGFFDTGKKVSNGQFEVSIEMK